MIEFRNVSKIFSGNCVLKDISLKINKGEIVTLIGPSGCGKTTTLKMINRLIKPTSGEIFIKGVDISKQDVIALRRNLGYIIQQTGLFPHMNIQENIEIIARLNNKDEKNLLQKTCELMELVGLEPKIFLKRYPSELSGGQQQRVGFARAFSIDPEIILMDEPFSALDPLTRASLQDELINLQQKLKKTIVFVTHDMDEAIKISDRLCIMSKGEIVQYDTPENILKNPINDYVTEFVGVNRIWLNAEYIKAEDFMKQDLVTCTPNLGIVKCLEIMRKNGLDSMPVIEVHTRKLLGIVTAKKLPLAFGKNLLVEEFMDREFPTVCKNTSIVDVLKIVDKYQVETIPVIDADNILQGLITKNNLLATLSQQYLLTEVV